MEAEISRKIVPINIASPAWERVSPDSPDDDGKNTAADFSVPVLDIPVAVDQRFFLRGFEEFRVHLLERAFGKR